MSEIKHLPTQLQQYVFISRYARWIEEKGRRETWEETVDRYCQFFAQHYPDAFPTEYINHSIVNQHAMPSMRALMTAGPALDRDHVAGYNCSYLPIDHVRAFDEILYILMCGTGVGFSVERQSIKKLPEIAEDIHECDTVITVADSKVGWATVFCTLIGMLYNGQIPSWDVSKVRPAGAKLKTFGGRASGPGPLVSLFKFAVALFKKAAGRRLTSIECHDLVCKIADIVVVGGVRRSALISLSNLSDDRMRVAKSGQWWEIDPQRALANNSAAYTEKPDMELFMEEWVSLVKSKSGERGIFNRVAAQKKAAENGRRDSAHEYGTNPCFKRGTLVHTLQGDFPIEELVGKKVSVWDGSSYVEIDNFRVTGTEQHVLRVVLHDGSEIVATPYHTFVLESGVEVGLRDLKVGDRLLTHDVTPVVCGVEPYAPYLKGFLLGDGTSNAANPLLPLYEPKYMCAERLIADATEIPAEDIKATNVVLEPSFGEPTGANRRMMQGLSVRRTELMDWVTTFRHGLPTKIYSWSLRAKSEFIAGLLDSDGTAVDSKNGFGYQLSNVSRELLLGVQALLKTMGVRSTLRTNREAGVKDFGEGHGGEYATQMVYRLTISQTSAVVLSKLCSLSRLTSFAKRSTIYNLKPRFNRVASIEYAGVEDEVFCCTVPTNHRIALTAGVITGQCGEIILRPCGFCNLTEVVVRADDNLEVLKEKVTAAVIMGTFQSTLTDFRYLRPIWKRNAEEERLLGVSLTGIMDHPVLSGARGLQEELKEWLTTLKEHAIEVNKIWAERLGIPQSVAITTVKPSGTVSQLVDAASGIHPRYAPYYIRTVRASKMDPLAQFMTDAGFPVEDCALKGDTTSIFSFPVKAPAHAVMRNDMTALQQLEHYLIFKRYWCEHNPSITVYVRDHEWLAVGDWVFNHFDDIGGVSFLPHSEHTYVQAPYQECTEAQYNAMASVMPATDWVGLQKYEREDTTVGTKTYACTGNSCELL